jgi:uncharacterized protein involved in response to NO
VIPVQLQSRDPAGRAIQPFALWRLGFRPFYLAASLFASLSVLAWAAQYAGLVPSYPGGVASHAHEMVFGFAFAVIAGFLFTAGRNWTNQATPTGAWLAAIVGMWLLARVLVFASPGWPAGVANAAFAIAVAIGLGVPLFRSRNRRNYFFVPLLLAMGAASLVAQLAIDGVIDVAPRFGVSVGLDLVLFVIAVMGGRVIPMFTNNGVPGTSPRRTKWIERAALGGVLLLLAFDVAGVRGAPLATLAALVALAHAWRLALWQPLRTLRVPLVWVLHAAYAWIPVHLVLRALAELDVVASPLATHALTIGTIGGMIVGMMTRTARGHTGRPLRADGFEIACYLLVLAAAIVRVLLPLAAPSTYAFAIAGSAVLWSAGFGLYAIRYWPALTRPRLDGKPG